MSFSYDNLVGPNAAPALANRSPTLSQPKGATSRSSPAPKPAFQSVAQDLQSHPTPALPGPVHKAGSVHTIPCNLEDDASIDAAIEAIGKAFGGQVHILVNNAGIGGAYTTVDGAKWELMDRCLRVNLRGVMKMTWGVLKYMKDIERGAIANISSVVSFLPISTWADYCASKAGLNHFTRTLFEDVGEKNIKVSAIMPG
ncbi:hypothetical protein HK104_009382 [Borealophlyctis nickersoniae]|nr:hypothetical protein HK104_009382 [Borealophlyctis nickersoniae]